MLSEGTETLGKAVSVSSTPGTRRGEDMCLGWHVPFAKQTAYHVGQGKNRV